MRYISTRGGESPKTFSEVLLMGLGTDGGLMVPEYYPQISHEKLQEWKNLNYSDLAFEIMMLYIDDIPENDLRDIIDRTYTLENFKIKEITPIKLLKNGLYLLGLSNGPTLAFKDIAMQFLGNAFEYVLTKQNKKLNILGATSGDTGSAAEYAMRSKENINVFMLSPHGKMSLFQRAQMYSLQDSNIFNIAIEGLFDDCQNIVKKVQSDQDFKEKYEIGTVNSINWARILAQVVYYFKAYLSLDLKAREKISFSVPSGNFGDICAGHIAKMMGLPVYRLIVATNENNVLEDFFMKGEYKPRKPEQVYITSSPSMDIANASNLERFVFDLVERNDTKIRLFWDQVVSGGGFSVVDQLEKVRKIFGFIAGKSTHQNRLTTIKTIYQENQYIIDTHTADGVYVALTLREENEKIICLETALAAKFEETIHEALGSDIEIPRPDEWKSIEDKSQFIEVMPNDVNLVKNFISEQFHF